MRLARREVKASARSLVVGPLFKLPQASRTGKWREAEGDVRARDKAGRLRGTTNGDKRKGRRKAINIVP